MSHCSSLLSENLGSRKGENIPFRGPPWGVGVGVILLGARTWCALLPPGRGPGTARAHTSPRQLGVSHAKHSQWAAKTKEKVCVFPRHDTAYGGCSQIQPPEVSAR